MEKKDIKSIQYSQLVLEYYAVKELLAEVSTSDKLDLFNSISKNFSELKYITSEFEGQVIAETSSGYISGFYIKKIDDDKFLLLRENKTIYPSDKKEVINMIEQYFPDEIVYFKKPKKIKDTPLDIDKFIKQKEIFDIDKEKYSLTEIKLRIRRELSNQGYSEFNIDKLLEYKNTIEKSISQLENTDMNDDLLYKKIQIIEPKSISDLSNSEIEDIVNDGYNEDDFFIEVIDFQSTLRNLKDKGIFYCENNKYLFLIKDKKNNELTYKYVPVKEKNSISLIKNGTFFEIKNQIIEYVNNFENTLSIIDNIHNLFQKRNNNTLNHSLNF